MHERITKNLPRNYAVGRLVNTEYGVYRIIQHGSDLGCFPGGRGMVTMLLEKFSSGYRLPEADLRKLEQLHPFEQGNSDEHDISARVRQQPSRSYA
jgi:hypothetical protein